MRSYAEGDLGAETVDDLVGQAGASRWRKRLSQRSRRPSSEEAHEAHPPGTGADQLHGRRFRRATPARSRPTSSRPIALGADVVAFPELALTGYPPEDLTFNPDFLAANAAALDELCRYRATISSPSSAISMVPAEISTTPRPSWRTDVLPASATRCGCPTTASSTSSAISAPALRPALFDLDGALIAVNICEDIWYPDEPIGSQVAAGADADHQHLRFAVPHRPHPHPRGDARDARPRLSDAGGAGQPGRRPGRARVRRQQPGLRRARASAGPRRQLSRKTWSLWISISRKSQVSRHRDVMGRLDDLAQAPSRTGGHIRGRRRCLQPGR